eukprot:s10621_g2.t1
MASEYVAVSRIRDALATVPPRYLKAVKTDCVVFQDQLTNNMRSDPGILERKKMGYLVKAINHAMRRKAENQSGPPVTVSEIMRGVPLQVTAQPKTPPAQPKTPPAEPKTPPGAVIKIEGGLELPALPPVPPRRRLPTPPRNPRTPSEAWSMVSSRDGLASREKKARIENPGQTVDELGQIVDPDGSIHVE